MVRALIVSLMTVLAGCASSPDEGALRAFIAQDVALTLPTPPGYPDTQTVVQTGHARYGERQAAFEAILSLAPERVEIVLTMPAGPRLATIVWDGEGVRQDRSILAPDGVPVENILADLFIAVWPADAVSAALPEDARLNVDEAGVRTVLRGAAVILTATRDPANPLRTTVRNDALGYTVTLVSQELAP